MARLIFTLTGISLLDEKKELLGKRGGFEKKLDNIKDQGNIKAIIADNAILKNQKVQVLKALAMKNLLDDRSDFSAELASLSELKAVDNKEDKIIFIISQTSECAFAGIVNGKYIIYERTNQDLDSISFNKSVADDVFSCDNVEIKIIEGLQVNDGKRFKSEGIKNLFRFIRSKIEDEGSSYDEVILNITGGYKGTIPYLSLFGMLFQEREIKGKKVKPLIKYLYEDTKDILILPNLPIAYDIFTWRNYRGFIKIVPHLESKVAETILDNILPAHVSDLFEKNDEKKFHLTTLGQVLKENYDEEKEGELTPYGRGYLLVDKICDDGKRKALQDCINRWQYLWLGDRIPETVEHARGHTQRVLELAAQILYPILNEEEKFFGNHTNDNLLALISAIWLHDLGHSGDSIKWPNDESKETTEYEIKGFPSLVRDLHHMLSWNLIDKDKNELFKSKNETNEWTWNKTIFSENLIKAICQICLYHRGKMPVSDDDNKDGYVGLRVTEPLENLRNDTVNTSLLGALLRVVDAGDVQEERTISPNYIPMRFLQNDREKEKLKKEEEEYRVRVDDLFSNSSTQLPDYLKNLKDNARKYFNNENTENFESMVYKCVHNYIKGEELENIDATGRIILRIWLSALDQYVFKNSPAHHFKKHRGISTVMYLLDQHSTENGNDEYHYKVLAIHKKDNDKNTKKVLNDIFCEYLMVKKILNNHRIFFDSYEGMEEESENITVYSWLNELC